MVEALLSTPSAVNLELRMCVCGGVPFSETKVAVTQKWAKLPYKAEPEALDTDERVKL